MTPGTIWHTVVRVTLPARTGQAWVSSVIRAGIEVTQQLRALISFLPLEWFLIAPVGAIIRKISKLLTGNTAAILSSTGDVLITVLVITATNFILIT